MDTSNRNAGLAPGEIQCNDSQHFTPIESPNQQVKLILVSDRHPNQVDEYINHGLKLCPLPPRSKSPRNEGWNRPGAELKSPRDLPDGWGVGLLHAASHTASLDIDDREVATRMLMEHGIDLQALLNADDAVHIVSGKENRAKLLYSLPGFIGPLPSKKITHKTPEGFNRVAFELRSATGDGLSVHCCIPPTVHPETCKVYSWGGKGHWSQPPTIPDELYVLWLSLLEKETQSTIKLGGTAYASWHEVESALNTIDPECSRDEWRNAGMALQSLGSQTGENGQAFELWNTWSEKSAAKYPGESEINSQWRSFKPDGGIGIGSLFHIAQEYGWVRPEPDVTSLFAPVVNQQQRFKLLTNAELSKLPPVKWLNCGLGRYLCAPLCWRFLF